ncbi:MAG: hypothetical protein Q4G07_08245 [Oscillospiraceae bacterium]|nr:hypothetical protein [Oscillospiraceae bacterium]
MGICCLGAGLLCAGRLSARRKATQDAAALLQELQRSLQYSKENFYIALRESAQYCSFQTAAVPQMAPKTGGTHEEYVKRWLEAAGFKKSLTPKGYALLYGTLCELGKGTGQADIQRLEHKRLQLQEEAQLLGERERRDAKLYRALGGYGGLVVTLLLL